MDALQPLVACLEQAGEVNFIIREAIHNTVWRCSPTPILFEEEGATEASQPSAAVLDDFKGVQPWEDFGEKAEVKTGGYSTAEQLKLLYPYCAFVSFVLWYII